MNQKKKAVTAAGIVALIFIFTATLALAAPPDNFTAKMEIMGMSMPMAKMGHKTRIENMMIGGLVTISQMDVQKSVTLNTKNKTYFESVIKEDKVPSLYDPKVVVEKKKIGSETIDGHPCIKSDAVIYLKDKPQDKFKAVIWEAQDLGGLPIRNEMTMPEGKTMGHGPTKIVSEMKEVKVGAATSAMFEVPKDYKKVGSMNEVMGMGQSGDMKGMQEMMKQLQKMKNVKPPKE
jgi:hypothetical protein